MEIHGRDLERIAELLFKLLCLAHAVVLDKEPHRAVTAIQVRVARTRLAGKERPMGTLMRTRVESEIRINEREHQSRVTFLHQLKAQLSMKIAEDVLGCPAKGKESRQDGYVS